MFVQSAPTKLRMRIVTRAEDSSTTPDVDAIVKDLTEKARA